MATVNTYNEYLKYINIRQLCKDYQQLGDYSRTTQILKGSRKLTKSWEFKMQTVLNYFQDDQFSALQDICKKPLSHKKKNG